MNSRKRFAGPTIGAPRRLAALLLAGLASLDCGADGPDATSEAEVAIPDESDWTDRGRILSAGPPGSWDVRLYGQISPCAVVKRGNTYYLYYIGADGDRSTDGGPRHRALGVATSTDGINFTKAAQNPILTFRPHGNEEEGIWSAAAAVDADGRTILYYGTLDAGSARSESVDADISLAVSADGISFDPRGDVLSHADQDVWGHGDEITPVGTFFADETWHVYYIAKGRRAYWDLGLARGPSPDRLEETTSVIAERTDVIGGGSPVMLSPNRLAVFVLRDHRDREIEVRTTSLESPEDLGRVAATYDFRALGHTTVYLDREAGTWLLFYRHSDNSIHLKTAPVSYVASERKNESS